MLGTIPSASTPPGEAAVGAGRPQPSHPRGAATVAAAKADPFKEFYDGLVARGIRPETARLTLARETAEVRFDAEYLKQEAA